ncbi:MAG: Rieske (2Fe-2S) protein [Bdellovibrio sp. CG12_big_fil_rev_8_21_14_0_65_39_13]|nr:MAG: Rieske (2Fe-2S) protein [Bdellovibrio sp. CG22_combo_CG10-13_8_21_14_all_39_27]PIQ61688.1 MAG: Rieske (2Fe-2S) protein [Bdellovibrio sp. CG12_big_fil_rev_8_21_14_0_65_39_13]PIR35631.1 MAG: Rieske (2Fe-2S) protein [Bdellovibrio sp. CG11_big_fil_rev_8_21_14_0_20_39_38]PJB53419.1 MAG: Rieske (2Fe-2S) protein [Bdellovibrio sp. CG_4_9_14_3_um_filter_39_7]
MSEDVRLQLNRREFFSFLSVAWIAFTAAVGGLLSLAFRFSYPNVNFEPEMEFLAGRTDEYPPGVDERWKNQFGVWMVKMEGRLFALSNICTHLGCIPTWLPAEIKFKCPCHGSGYYMNGVNFEGPAPRPLERYKITLTAEGKIKVDKTKVFRQEKGEWDNPDSYLTV